MHVDWFSSKTEMLLNPRCPEKERLHLEKVIQAMHIKNHVCIATSGSHALKWVLLEKDAILASAEAVNHHLQSDQSDIWINPLPSFHVGGLGIWARSHLSGAQVIAYQAKWNAEKFHQHVCNSRATLCSLVPTQVYDLVSNKLACPPSLRSIVVGGGALNDALYHQAKALGWKVLPSYGMSECASQIATATVDDPSLKILPHIEVKINEAQYICIKSPSLLTGYLIEGAFIDPKVDGWLVTEDFGAFVDGELKVHGRTKSFVKIGGELVNLLRLEKILEEVKLALAITIDMALVAIPDERLGHIVCLASTSKDVGPLVEKFQEHVFPFERIRNICVVSHIPRNALGKELAADLKEMVYTQASSRYKNNVI